MGECLNCGKELEQLPHKRAKVFCDSTCRSNYWQKQNRKAIIHNDIKAMDLMPVNAPVLDKQTAKEEKPPELSELQKQLLLLRQSKKQSI